MNTDVEEIREQLSQLLETTFRETQLALSNVDLETIVYHEQPAWRVRDVLGHLGVWNNEAVKSLQAHAEGREYHCIPSEAGYDIYNSAAVEERRSWTAEQVWAEYEAAFDQFKRLVQAIPADKWHSEMLYPWNHRGTVRLLIEIMMQHEVEHRQDILEVISS